MNYCPYCGMKLTIILSEFFDTACPDCGRVIRSAKHNVELRPVAYDDLASGLLQVAVHSLYDNLAREFLPTAFCIKVFRNLTGLGLSESKDYIQKVGKELNLRHETTEYETCAHCNNGRIEHKMWQWKSGAEIRRENIRF